MTWDVAPACTEVSQDYGCTDYSGEFRCPACGPGYFHAGIDLSGPSVFRTPVVATRSGVINAVGIQYLGDSAVGIRTDEGPTIEHGHLDEAHVSVGQRVNVGDIIGLLGTKGISTGPHLHLEVRVDGPNQGVSGCPDNDPTRNPIPYLRASRMIAGLDSSFFRPTAAIAQSARAAGVQLWGGYLTTQGNVGIAAPWSQADFEAARLCGGMPLAYCSGWDDPVVCKKLAAAWNVRLCLDVENGIRGDGSWVQDWLNQSGAGIYGNAPVHVHQAPFHVLAGYPGSDPGTVWPDNVNRPNEPVGWQWQGTHDEFGGAVDRGWFEDWFLSGGDDLTPEQAQTLSYMKGLVEEIFNFEYYGGSGGRGDSYAKAKLLTRDEFKAALAGIGTAQVDVDKLAASIVAKLPPDVTRDPKVFAQAVVDEIGTRWTRVKPA